MGFPVVLTGLNRDLPLFSGRTLVLFLRAYSLDVCLERLDRLLM